MKQQILAEGRQPFDWKLFAVGSSFAIGVNLFFFGISAHPMPNAPPRDAVIILMSGLLGAGCMVPAICYIVSEAYGMFRFFWDLFIRNSL